VVTQQVLPLQPLPAQTLEATLDGQDCEIILQQMVTGLFASLSVAGQQVIAGRYCNDRVGLVRQQYLGFLGWLYFVDTQGDSDPSYDGLGSRYILVYESA
jgi:hypothetical protein